MLTLPDTDTLRPQTLNGVYAFPSANTELVKLDLLFEAGSAYQTKKLCASAVAKLFSTATQDMDASTLAEFMDYRGILVESDCQVQQASSTFYFLRRYADELIPVVAGMLRGMAFSDADFTTWKKQRRQEIMSAMQKPADMARRAFYNALFGDEHPLGRYAVPEDLDALTADDVHRFFDCRYRPELLTVVAAGAVDEALVNIIKSNIPCTAKHIDRQPLAAPTAKQHCVLHTPMDDTTQTSIRIGRVLPLRWNDPDYAHLMLLITALGGYFGSRLMCNLREDKGYTYGIYARSQIYRGVTVFYVTADVAAGSASAAIDEVKYELRRLIDSPIADEELELVKTVFTGDFLRSVDGIFERSARFCDMYATDVDERITENLRTALASTTPQRLQQLALRYLSPDDMTVCTAGA